MPSMNLYKGKLVLDIATIVETSDQKDMTEQAHAGLTSELYNEVMALVGAKGYITQSIGSTLKDNGVAYDLEVERFKESKLDAINRADSIYNKANRIVIKLE